MTHDPCMYYRDLSPYTYHRELEGIESTDYSKHVSVGWLDSKFTFPTGDAPPDFLEKLFLLCLKPLAETRGFHSCNLCKNPNYLAQTIAERNGVVCYLGNGEVHVASFDRVYVAPTLIYHYVSAHLYLPPGEFIDAVLLS